MEAGQLGLQVGQLTDGRDVPGPQQMAHLFVVETVSQLADVVPTYRELRLVTIYVGDGGLEGQDPVKSGDDLI